MAISIAIYGYLSTNQKTRQMVWNSGLLQFMLTYLRNGFGESDPDLGLAANSNSRSGVFGCSFSSWSFSSSSSSKDLNFGTMGVLSRPGSG